MVTQRSRIVALFAMGILVPPLTMSSGCGRKDTGIPDEALSKGPKLSIALSACPVAFKGLPCLVEIKLKNLSVSMTPEETSKIPSKEERLLAHRAALLSYTLPQFEFFSMYPPVSVRVRRKGSTILQPDPPGELTYWLHPHHSLSTQRLARLHGFQPASVAASSWTSGLTLRAWTPIPMN